MRGKLSFVVGLGAGYLLGARAGRERYDQIMGKAQEVLHDPQVREKAGQAQQAVQDKAEQAAHAVQDKKSSDSPQTSYQPNSTTGTRPLP